MSSSAILSNFFEEERTQNYPQYLSGLSRALFPTTFLEIAVYAQCSSMSNRSFLSFTLSIICKLQVIMNRTMEMLINYIILKWKPRVGSQLEATLVIVVRNFASSWPYLLYATYFTRMQIYNITGDTIKLLVNKICSFTAFWYKCVPCIKVFAQLVPSIPTCIIRVSDPL